MIENEGPYSEQDGSDKGIRNSDGSEQNFELIRPEDIKGDTPLSASLRRFAVQSRDAKQATRSSEIQLPTIIHDKFLQGTMSGGPGLIKSILKDQSVINALVETEVFSDKKEIAEVLKQVVFGDADSDTVKNTRQLADTVDAAHLNSPVRAVIAEFLLQHRVNSKQHMALADEILRVKDPDLADNLERLLSNNSDIQEQAFHWLFERMVTCAEQAMLNPENQATPLVYARIIFKQVNKVLSDTDHEQWMGLQTHIIMRFAERMSLEHHRDDKPLLSALLAFEPELSRDLILAADKNFARLSPQFNLREEKESETLAKSLKPYGGFESYAQGIETILSFGAMVWPDWTYNYLEPKLDRAPALLRAQYVSILKYAIHDFNDDGSCNGFHSDRLNRCLNEILELSSERYAFLLSRLNGVLDHAPQATSSFLICDAAVEQLSLEDNGCSLYTVLPDDKRSFYADFLLRQSTRGPLTGGRERVLPFMMFEIEQDENTGIQSRILFSDYFNKDLLDVLTDSQAKQLRARWIEDNITFFTNDLLQQKVITIMNHFGIASVDEAFDAYEMLRKTNYQKALGALTISSHAAEVLDARGISGELEIYNRVVGVISDTARELSISKQEQIAYYDDLRKRLGNAHKLLEGSEEQYAAVANTAAALNEKVAGIDRERRELERQNNQIEQNKRNEAIQKEEDAGAIKELKEQIRARSWGEYLGVAKAPDGQLPIGQLKANLSALRDQIAQSVAYRQEEKKTLAENKRRLKEMIPEMERAQADQVKMTEALDAVKDRQEKLKEIVTNAESSIEVTIEILKKDQSYAEDAHIALRRFLRSLSLSSEVAGSVDEKMRVTTAKVVDGEEKVREQQDGHLLVTELALASDPRFATQFSVMKSAGRLAHYIRHNQMARGIYLDEVKQELGFLSDLLEDGTLAPNSIHDPVLQLYVEGIRSGRFQLNTKEELARVATSMDVARRNHDKLTENVTKQVERVLGSGTANMLPPLQEFFRMKFPPKEGQTKSDGEDIMVITFCLIAGEQGLQAAITSTFYMLSGQGGEFFCKPEDTDAVPVNRAQQIDRRYKQYYDSAMNLQTTIRSGTLKTFRLEEGLGWEREANDMALHFLTRVFRKRGVPPEVKRIVEAACVDLVLYPWTQEDIKQKEADDVQRVENDEQDDEWMNQTLAEIGSLKEPHDQKRAEEVKKRMKTVVKPLSFTQYAILRGALEYVEEAPAITPEQAASDDIRKRLVGHHDARTLSLFSYWYARRIVVSLDRIQSAHDETVLKTLEKLNNTIDKRFVVTEPNSSDSIRVQAVIEEAITKIRGRMGLETVSPYAQAALPKRPSHFALPSERIERPELLESNSSSGDVYDPEVDEDDDRLIQ